MGLNTVLLWAHLHGNEPFNLVSSRDDDGDEGGGGGGSDSDSDSEEATPDVLMLKVNLDVENKARMWSPTAPPASGWPRLAGARGSPRRDLAQKEVSGAPAAWLKAEPAWFRPRSR